jgi:periplasmic protein TonB
VFTNLRFERTHWSLGGVVAIAGHAAVVAAMILQLDFSHAMQVTSAPMVVELARLPTAPPVPETELPLGPKQQQQLQSRPLRQIRKPLFDPPPEVPTPVPPVVAVERQEKVEPQTQTAAKTVEQTTAPVTTQAPPDQKLTAAASAASRRVEANAEATWEGKILARLEAKKRYPRAAQARHEEDAVYVKFSVNRRGEVLPGSAVVRSNGFALLDAEVLDLLKRASPLPPPPAEVSGEAIEMVVPVDFYLRVASTS